MNLLILLIILQSILNISMVVLALLVAATLTLRLVDQDQLVGLCHKPICLSFKGMELFSIKGIIRTMVLTMAGLITDQGLIMDLLEDFLGILITSLVVQAIVEDLILGLREDLLGRIGMVIMDQRAL